MVQQLCIKSPLTLSSPSYLPEPGVCEVLLLYSICPLPLLPDTLRKEEYMCKEKSMNAFTYHLNGDDIIILIFFPTKLFLRSVLRSNAVSALIMYKHRHTAIRD